MAVYAIGIVWIHHGLGRHENAVRPTDLVMGFKLLWISDYPFQIGVTLSKISVLFFYTRVFTTHSVWFKRALWLTGCLSTAWTTAFIFAQTFQCTPIYKYWIPAVPGTCVSVWMVATLHALFDAILDVIILVLPMPMVWRLHVGRNRKISIFLAFFCGYL